jgi:hypothetical protein
MLKNIVRIESTISERTRHWYLDNDCPLNIAKEMLFQFQKYIGNIEDNVKAQQEQAKKEAEAKAAETPVESPNEDKIEQIG